MALFPVAPTFPPLDAHLIFKDGRRSWVIIVHRDGVALAKLSVQRSYTELHVGESKA